MEEPTREQKIEILLDAMNDPRKMKTFKEILRKYMPPEMAGPIEDVIDGSGDSFEQVEENIQDNVLDAFNDGSRTKEEMEIMLRPEPMGREDLKALGVERGINPWSEEE